MTSTTILTVLLVFSFLIGRFLRRFETPHFVFSGVIYLIIGLLLGSYMGFGILSEELLYRMDPLIDLLTGFAGFLLGVRVKFLMQNKKTFFSGIISGLLVFVAMTITFYFLAPLAVEFENIGFDLGTLNFFSEENASRFKILGMIQEINRRQFWFALGVSATACSASLLSLGMISKFHKTRSEITRVLSILAPTGQVVAVTLLGIVLAMASGDTTATSLHISIPEWLLATITSGLLCGLLFSLFIGKQSDENRIMLAALGAIIFAAGLGTLLSVSSMFVCFITGLTIGLFSTYAAVLKENLIRIEEPIFVLLLVFGGATWRPEINQSWLLPATYFVVRAILLTGFVHRIYTLITKRKLSRLGQGLLGQDLIAVAIALSLSKEFPELSQLFLTTILGSIFFNDVVANSVLKKVILDNEQVIEVKPIEEGDE